MLPKVIVIVGQTATGKSDLAVKIAKNLNGLSRSKGSAGRTSRSEVLGEVISADSRQVYKGLDIGTGKITLREMKGVPHHLLDVADPKKKFTVVEFQKLADKKITNIVARGHIPIICGGTGFYIDTVTNSAAYPEVPPNLRLRKKLSKKTTPKLFEQLVKLDKARAKTIDRNNPVRLIRAIEIAKYLGKVPKIKKGKAKYEFIKIGLTLPEAILKKKIEKRVKKMFKDGLHTEIKNLKKLGVSIRRLREFGFEYTDPTKESVITGTIKYAKRQNTWFKRDKEIKWFSPTEYKKIEKYLARLLK